MDAKQLVENLAKALVDSPEKVVVNEVWGEKASVLQLKVAKRGPGKGDRQARQKRQCHEASSGSRRHKGEEEPRSRNSGVTFVGRGSPVSKANPEDRPLACRKTLPATGYP
jgi:hypothetical protein